MTYGLVDANSACIIDRYFFYDEVEASIRSNTQDA